ncbi:MULTISPECIES: selenocysteine-specific translation elongation factor [unclassified Photobacterium]|uniref:selenocysteine-specific translation elongation factor n=1 Tax=unclassified Photobacterium TaxID=2628852 RepID=UPI000D154B2A|nr:MULTISPECIES: selenocysteine-specific translation elongation factor [unclassified Photobacterium]PSV38569.1 selenocysteine-specific translation elongation factor [Photobacterium sp. GB-210]PSV45914.1 selenocysteine-specific translation elongation factor [Photobacterium sp. GB-36]
MVSQPHNVEKYQAVIGLAGHVDHGKTALIEALTGIVTARPHEQQLGMTQDLGFAYFKDDNNNTIGVVDVPGHERYLRNMVSGVWHLNVLLLVIAADEGWMPMTTSHLQVAHAMGIEDIVVCINKRDKVTAEQLSAVEDQALDNVMEMTGLLPEIISVSALKNDNIPALRDRLIEAVKANIDRKASTDIADDQVVAPIMYIDRSFVVNGMGTVLTGTLAQGTLSIGDKVRCFPSNIMGTVRSLQAYHQQHQQLSATCRVAVNVKGISRKEVGRGHLLTSATITPPLHSQCIVRINKTSDKLKQRKQRHVEVAMGTWHGSALLSYIPNTQLARLTFEKPIPMIFGQRLAMIQKGGCGLQHGAEIVWSTPVMGYQKRRLYQALDNLPVLLKPESQREMLLALQGYFETTEAGFESAQGQTYLTPYCFEDSWLADNVMQIQTLLSDGISMSSAEIATRLRINEAVIDILMQQLKLQEKVHVSYGKWCLGQGDNEDELPPVAQEILQQIRELGKAGLELNKVTVAGGKKWLRQLSHQKYITALDDTIYFDMGLYLDLVKAVIAEHQPQDRISMGDIKDRTELSRKYSIPLANRMEKDGWVRRDGDERIILKAWDQ